MPRFTSETAREAGRKGSKARAARCDMKALGARGGKATHARYGSDHMARIGHGGALSTARRYGYTFLFRRARAWRLENPSRHERQIMAILEELGQTEYEREALILGEDVPVAVDFAFRDDRKAIEANGKVHYDRFFNHLNYPTTRRNNEEERLKRVRRAGWEVLVIDYREMDTAAGRIAAFLAK